MKRVLHTLLWQFFFYTLIVVYSVYTQLLVYRTKIRKGEKIEGKEKKKTEEKGKKVIFPFFTGKTELENPVHEEASKSKTFFPSKLEEYHYLGLVKSETVFFFKEKYKLCKYIL